MKKFLLKKPFHTKKKIYAKIKQKYKKKTNISANKIQLFDEYS